MNEQLKLLIELQEIDSVILSMSDKIESLPSQLEKFRTPLKEAELAFQKTKAQTETFTKNRKNKEAEAEEIQEKIIKLKSKSKEIKTNKDYEAYLKEIEGFEKSKFKIEDDILSIMESMETFAKNIHAEESKVRKAEEEFKQQEKLIEEEKVKYLSEMASYKARRKEFLSKIDSELYEQYINLLKKAAGVAVVRTKNEICLGCNNKIPPQQYNDIKKNEAIFNCYYCKRFLYFKEEISPSVGNNS